MKFLLLSLLFCISLTLNAMIVQKQVPPLKFLAAQEFIKSKHLLDFRKTSRDAPNRFRSIPADLIDYLYVMKQSETELAQKNYVAIIDKLAKDRGYTDDYKIYYPPNPDSNFLKTLTNNINPSYFKSRSSENALFSAVGNGNLNLVEWLFDNGVNINSHIGGCTVLMSAIRNRNRAMINLVLKYNPNINALCTDGNTPLFLAAIYGDKDLVRLLVNRGGNLEDVDVIRGQTALIKALYESRFSGLGPLEALLVNGAKVNRQNQDGLTLLNLAIEEKLSKVIELLIRSGADVNKACTLGKTPLAREVFNVCERLSQNSSVDLANVRLLLENDANPNIRCSNASPLPLLSYVLSRECNGRAPLVQLLLTKANPNSPDNSGKTPLMHECSNPNSNPAIVKLLLQNHANVNALDNAGNSAMDYAYENYRKARSFTTAIENRLAIMHKLCKRNALMNNSKKGSFCHIS
jgi:ankyrin repeat protein